MHTYMPPTCQKGGFVSHEALAKANADHSAEDVYICNTVKTTNSPMGLRLSATSISVNVQKSPQRDPASSHSERLPHTELPPRDHDICKLLVLGIRLSHANCDCFHPENCVGAIESTRQHMRGRTDSIRLNTAGYIRNQGIWFICVLIVDEDSGALERLPSPS